MNPVPRDLYVDQLLTNIVLGYQYPLFIADQIAPLVQVTQDSGIIPAMTQSPWFRNTAELRAPGTPSKGHGFGTDLTATYTCRRYSFRHEIDDDTRRNAGGSPFDLDSLSSKFVTAKLQLKREVNWAGSFFKTGVWTDKTGGSTFARWDDYGASQPTVDVETYKVEIEGKVGVDPNTLIIGRESFAKLKYNPDLVDMIKYTQRGQLSADLVASLLELPRLLIGRAIYTTSPDGTAESSVTYTRIWGKNALLAYVASSPSIMEPSASYTFWVPREGAPANAPQYIKRMRNEESEIDIIEANSYFDQKVTMPRSGIFLSSVTN